MTVDPAAIFPELKLGTQTKRLFKKPPSLSGPFAFDVTAAAPFGPCRSLSQVAPEGDLPALRLGSVRGFPLILLVQSDQLVVLHHDATLYEVAHDVAQHSATLEGFTTALASRGSAFKLTDWLRLCEATADWTTLHPESLHPAQRHRALAEGLRWKVSKLRKLLTTRPTTVEVLDLDGLVLDDLVAAERKLRKLAKTEPGGAVDLGYCYLDALPEQVHALNPRRLVLDGNPTLDWTAATQTLKSLDGLEVLSVAACDLGDASELAAQLEGVRVRTGAEGLQAKLRAMAAQPQTATHLDLSGQNLKKLPPQVLELTALHTLDLSLNPKLDFEATFTALRDLPSLRLVRFHDNGLAAIPEAFKTLTQLTHFEVAAKYRRKTRNSFEHIEELAELLRALPNLEHVDFGDLSIGPWRASSCEPSLLPICPNLTSVKLQIQRGSGGALYWLAELPNLSSLNLEARVDLPIQPLLRCKGLKCLELHGEKASQHIQALTENLPELEAVRFDWHGLVPEYDQRKGYTVPFPPAIRNLTKLRRLEVIWGKAMTFYDVKIEPPPEWLGELTTLEQLALEMHEDAGWQQVPEAVFALHKLTHLRLVMLSKHNVAPPVGLSRLPELTHLELRHFTREAPAGFDVPSTLQSYQGRGIDGLPEGIEACQDLHTVEAGTLTEAQTQALGDLPALRTLFAHWSGPLSSPTLEQVNGSGPLGQLPALRSLEMYKALSLAEPLPSLQELIWGPERNNPAWGEQISQLADCDNLGTLMISNFWPKSKGLPTQFGELKQLHRLTLFASGLGGSGTKATLQQWLPDTLVSIR